MQAIKQRGAPDPERLTWEQIRERYPDQHVYVVQAERKTPTHPELLTAIVVGAGATEDEAFVQAKPWWLPGQLLARRFTGRSRKPLRRPPVYLGSPTKPLIRPPVYFHDET